MGIADLHPPRPAVRRSGAALSLAGLDPTGVVHWNLTPPELYEHAVRRGEGQIVEHGPFCAITTPHTGRSPGDKFIVREPESEDHVWWGKVNQPLAPEHFLRLREDMLRYLNGQALSVRELYPRADQPYRLPVRLSPPTRGRRYSSTPRPCDPS